MPAFSISNHYQSTSASEAEEEEENYKPKNSKSKPRAKPKASSMASNKMKSSSSSSLKRSRGQSEHHQGQDEDEEEGEDPELEEEPVKVVRASKTNTSRKQQKPSASNGRVKSHHSAITTTEEASDDEVEATLRRESRVQSSLEARFNATKAELQAVQQQLDELRELRITEAEALLHDYKKMSEARHKHSEDLIASLKSRLASSEKKIRRLEEGGDSSMTRISATPAAMGRSYANQEEIERLAEIERERDEALEHAKSHEEENHRLRNELKMTKTELKAEIANSKNLQQSVNSRINSKSTNDPVKTVSSSRELEEHKDLLAMKSVYEDLTAVIFTKVETYDLKDGFRRFVGFYSKKDSHNLEFYLEESKSEIQDSRGKLVDRNDLVYIPQIDQDRDAQLIEALQGKKKNLQQSIRFDRNMATAFFKMLVQNLEMKKH